MIHLEKVCAKNLWDLIELKVAKDQKGFVAPNDSSLLEAYLAVGSACRAFPFGI